MEGLARGVVVALLAQRRRGRAERVVRAADRGRVAEREARVLGPQPRADAKVAEAGELVAEREARAVGGVEQHRHERLRRARVGDHLRREENAFLGVGGVHEARVLLLLPLEEEDEAEDGLERGERVAVGRPELRDLGAARAHALD